LPISRRSILRGAASSIGAATTFGLGRFALAASNPAKLTQAPSDLVSETISSRANDPLWGMAMSYGEKRLDLIDLDNAQIIHSIEGFEASHAITPIEHLNRFVVHGYRPAKKAGALLIFQVNPVTKAWSLILDKEIKGGRLLHWQPRPDLSEIVFNTIEDGSLHVLDTKSLEITHMGKHLGVIPSLERGERCWFCWTPQGARFTHDVAWNWDEDRGDYYQPYLTAVDMKTARIERIPTGSKDIQPSFLQVSPDGLWGLTSLRGRDDIGIFNLQKNSFEGTVKAGPARPSFFERDMAFCKNRDFALVTNTAEKSISLLNLKRREEVRRIYLPRRPTWFKSLSV